VAAARGRTGRRSGRRSGGPGGVAAALWLGLAACAAPEDAGLTRPERVPATPFAQEDVWVDGLRLRVVDEGPRGDGTKAVLVLPGHTARIEDYDALVAPLAARRRVVLPDLPGKGYSDKPVRRYDFAFYEEVVLGLLDALGLERVHLAGGSLGGNLALRLAAHAPERVDRVVAWGPGSAWEARPWLAALIRRVGGYPLFWPAIRVHSRFWFSADNPDRERLLAEKFAYYEEIMSPGFVRMYVDMAAASVGSSLFDVAPDVQAPVLLIRGARDDGGGLEEGLRQLQARLPDAELLEIPDARHALTTEAPESLARAIAAFLDRPSEAVR